MSTTFSPLGRPASPTADTALKAAATFWFAVLVIGQVIFAASVGLFYGLTALRGNWQAWNRHLAHGYVPGDPAGNAALVAHLVVAVLLTLGGAVQLIPLVRRRAPGVHRWNGRLYVSGAIIASGAGLYMEIVRGTQGSTVQQTGQDFLALLIIACAAMAFRHALRRDFVTHRRWALRLFLLVSAALFIRAGVTLTAMLIAGTGTLDLTTIQGPVLTVMTFAQFCVPLAILEGYFWARARAGGRIRTAFAAALTALTIVMGAGIAAASAGIFLPSVRAALDPRPSIAEALAPTIRSNGIDAAIRQYDRLKAAQPRTYNFDESELNGLGYDLLRAHSDENAIQIFRLNTMAYPRSGNTWDSLGEATMDHGDTQQAIAYYRRSLALNPANYNAILMLRRMRAR